MLNQEEHRLQEYLESFITTRRKERMKYVLSQRTRYIACVLEDLYDPRNGSAVIRHCDALGIQEIHAIENKNRFRSDDQVDMGTAQWLDLRVKKAQRGIPRSVKALRRAAQSDIEPGSGSNTPEVLNALKERGYRIVSTSPHGVDDVTPETLDLEAGPVAVIFGTEKHGISEEVRERTDIFLRIPMVGFVESFNISASAAIVFHVLSNRIRREGIPWELESEDAEEIYFRWVKASAPHAEKLIGNYHENRLGG